MKTDIETIRWLTLSHNSHISVAKAGKEPRLQLAIDVRPPWTEAQKTESSCVTQTGLNGGDVQQPDTIRPRALVVARRRCCRSPRHSSMVLCRRTGCASTEAQASSEREQHEGD